MRRTLVTGGAGYIGSHCCVELLCAGFDVTVVDNLSNGCEDALRRVESISGRRLEFHEADLRDRGALDRIVRDGRFESVIHFAGLKAVGESARLPLEYYENNVGGTLVLLDCMRRHGPRRLVFSSSATVYGDPEAVPIREDAALRPTNPYGRTKLFIEEILRDLAATCDGWHIALLRYFNPVGAHQSGLIGEDPRGTPNNLMPYIMQVAVGRIPELQVFGNDYPTHDGTGVRDYIHVVDLSKGHLAALDHLDQIDGAQAWNLGTGRGYSVLEVVAAASEASGRAIPYRVTGRRVGDVAEVYADPSRATADLSWRADLDLERMCADSWRWQRQNPRGFE